MRNAALGPDNTRPISLKQKPINSVDGCEGVQFNPTPARPNGKSSIQAPSSVHYTYFKLSISAQRAADGLGGRGQDYSFLALFFPPIRQKTRLARARALVCCLVSVRARLTFSLSLARSGSSFSDCLSYMQRTRAITPRTEEGREGERSIAIIGGAYSLVIYWVRLLGDSYIQELGCPVRAGRVSMKLTLNIVDAIARAGSFLFFFSGLFPFMVGGGRFSMFFQNIC